MNETLIGASYDGLLGGAESSVLTRNANLTSDTTIERGSLLVLENGKLKLATAADSVGKALYIGAENASGVTTTTVYAAGRFNRSAIKTTADLTKFEEELRRQNIILTEAIGND